MCWNEKEVHLYNPVIQDHLARRSWVRIPPRARVSQPPMKLVRVVRIPLTISVKQMRLTWHTHSVQHSRRYRSYVFVPLNRRTIHSFRHHVEGLFTLQSATSMNGDIGNVRHSLRPICESIQTVSTLCQS